MKKGVAEVQGVWSERGSYHKEKSEEWGGGIYFHTESHIQYIDKKRKETTT